jgi:beta-glucosidase
MKLSFPRNFVWGVATSAPQIEGAAFEDGKAASVWDTYARLPGKIHNGDTLDVACDHYHRFNDDVALMAKFGVKHYRLSIAWPRIFPSGRGAVNQKGLDFYHRLFEALLRRGITPWVTMFHWDLPQALEDVGGWRVRGVTGAFAEYADTIVKAYGDRVKHWITVNEIVCFTRHGYGGGGKAPGANDGEAVVNQTYHHALLAHGHGVRAVREYGGRGARVGLADNSCIPVPVTETERDIAAARRLFVSDNLRVLDPIFRGRYAPAYRRQPAAPKVAKGDFDLIAAPIDFLGMNIYYGGFVRDGKYLPLPPHYPRADSTWLELVPQAMYWGPRLAADVYGVKSICITENGAGYDDLPPVNGEAIDLHRREYARNCLVELHRAIDDGVPVRAYFLWSFLDNFEWADGYDRRFGLVYTDFKTQRRTPKLSAYWYQQVMAENRVV